MSNLDPNEQTPDHIQSAIDAGIGLADIGDRIQDVDGIPVALVPNGMTMRPLKDVLELADSRDTKPHRLRGTAHHHEIASFIAHVNAFKDEDSVVYADCEKVTLTAVLNYHRHKDGGPRGDEGARWADHRSIYACPLSREWKTWTAKNEKAMSQEEFAQFVEDNMVDLASPTAEDGDLYPKPAAVLEMALKLTINLQGEFSRSINPTTGESTLVNKTEHGPNSTKIFKSFLLGIPVFEAGARYRVEARIRFQLEGGRARFSYALYQPEAIKRDAFAGVRAEVEKGTSLAVFAGTPEA